MVMYVKVLKKNSYRCKGRVTLDMLRVIDVIADANIGKLRMFFLPHVLLLISVCFFCDFFFVTNNII